MKHDVFTPDSGHNKSGALSARFIPPVVLASSPQKIMNLAINRFRGPPNVDIGDDGKTMRFSLVDQAALDEWPRCRARPGRASRE